MKNFYFHFIHSFIQIQILLLFLSYNINAQTFSWAKGISGNNNNIGYSIKNDASGNSYVTGQFQGTATFDTIQLTSYGGNDIFIAKYSPSGNCLWAKQAGGSADDFGRGIAVDTKGNIFITGYFTYVAAFDTIQLINNNLSSPSYDIFIARYDPNGSCLWAKKAGGASYDYGFSISVDANSNCYVTGSFTGIVSFDTTQLTGYGLNDIFIAKYDIDGNFIWVRQDGGDMNDYGISISTDPNGNSYITGDYQDTSKFGTFKFYGFGGFITKYDPDGNCIWAKGAPGSSGIDIAFDGKGNSYFTGYFEETAKFDSIQINGYVTHPSNEDIFIAKYDPNGNCLWAKPAGSSHDDAGKGISVDTNGNSYITGYFAGTVSFGTFQLTTYHNNPNIFIAKYNSLGNCIWVKNAGGIGATYGYAISNDTKGNIYCAGSFTYGPATFDTILLPVSGAFIAKISDDPLPVELSSFTCKAMNNSINLDWVTQTELNNFLFEVERKNQNGIWTKIGEIKGAGNSNIPHQYSYLDKSLPNAKYYYRLKQLDFNGQYKYSNELEINVNFVPKAYSLENNFPNPFNPATIIRYSLPYNSNVKLTIYNSLGQVIKELISEVQQSGLQEISFDASSLSSGVYFYSMQANSIDGNQNFTATKKMLLLK
jgi:hypothetical protein